MKVLVNGILEYQISVNDRALQYGDGLFETLAVIDQKIHNWDKHFLRLSRGVEILRFKPLDEQCLLTEINSIIDTKQERQIVKLMLSRGSGGRGYAIPSPSNSLRIVSQHSWPSYPKSYYFDGVDIAEVSFRLGIQRALAGLKHLNRLEQVMAKNELSKTFQEGLLLNHEDYVIEGISSNIYFVHEGVLCMPELKCSGIAGTIRAQVIDLCREWQIPYAIADYKIDVLSDSSEVFLSNSIIGLWPVKSITLLLAQPNQQQQFLPGPIYHQLSAKINQQLLYYP